VGFRPHYPKGQELSMRALKPRSKRGRSPAKPDIIGKLISEQNLRPGERLPSIRALSAKLGVKAGTVRDALIAAESQGLVKVLPRLGAIVQSMDETQPSSLPASQLARTFPKELDAIFGEQDQNLFHILDTREELELATIERAVRKRELPDLFTLRQLLESMGTVPVTEESPEYVQLDIQFHLEIARLSGNAVMTSVLAVLLRELAPHLNRIRWSVERRHATNASHARIYSSLVAGDCDWAQREIRDHVRTAFNSLLDEMRDPPPMNGH
jgi:GntR family transcriptional repressor for pyruvate dehydrogenase complex